jgi:hypothetical protein
MCLGTKWSNSYYLFFLAGTSTPTNIYQNGALTLAFSPTGRVTSDAFGRFPAIYLDPSVIYRVQFFSSANVQQWQVDPYTSQLSTVGTSALSAFGFQIAPTGEFTLDAPNTGGTGITLTLKAGDLGSTPLRVTGTLPGNSALIVNNSATTGAQTATFVATNKPGTATSSPAGWLPITCDGVQYYTPIWHGNNFTPYIANPGALGEVISGSSVTFTGSGLTTTTGGSAVPSNWFAPTSAGIGAGYYINITRTGGTVNFSAAQGAWTNIGAGGLTVTLTASGSVTGTYQLSTSPTGSPIVANGTISLSNFTGTRIYTSGTAATETIPLGAFTVAIEVWGGNGGGGSSNSSSPFQPGGGGGAGAYVRSSISVTGGNTFLYTVGAAGAGNQGAQNQPGGNGGSSVVSAGTQAITTMTAPGASGGSATGAGGAGSASGTGGNLNNSSGSTGGNFSGTTGGVGAFGIGGFYGTTGLSGGNGANTGGINGAPGGTGQILFKYT